MKFGYKKMSPMDSIGLALGMMSQCYTFNSVEFNHTTTLAGLQHGLDLMLFVDQDNYIATSSPSAGYRFMMHDPKEIPMIAALGIQVGPGFYTTVAMQLEEVHELPYPYTDCVEDPDYRTGTCFFQCMLEYFSVKCDCVVENKTGNSSESSCGFAHTITCQLEEYQAYILNASTICSCPPECVRSRYVYTISQSVRSAHYQQNIEQVFNITAAEQTRNYVTVNLFYSTLTYTQITVRASYNFMALLSDIGGALGLLLGATILTFYQIGEFVYDMLLPVVIFNFRKQKTSTQSSYIA